MLPPELIPLFVALLVGLLIGFLAAWWIQKSRLRQDPAFSGERFRQLEDERNRLAQTAARLEGEQSQLVSGREQMAGNLRQLEQELKEALERASQADQTKQHLEAQLAEKADDFENVQKKLQDRFNALASELLEKTTEKFSRSHQERLDQLLSPFKKSLDEFKDKSEKQHADHIEGRGKLFEHLRQLKDLNHQLTDQAQNLTTALKGDSQQQGAWGELILENVLARSGLTRGEEYETQESFTTEDGQRFRPDVIIHYPEQKGCLIIDSKVSLVAYERHCNAETEEEREQALKAHLASLRNHIKGLGEKGYDRLPGIQSPEFVLLFIPIEHAFNVAAREDPGLYDYAFDRNVVLITPATLLATLKMVKSIWRQDRQSKNAVEIAEQAGRLYDKFVLFHQSLGEVGTHLDRARGSYEKSMNQLEEGRGSLTSRVEGLRKLGAKASKALPEAAIARSELDLPPGSPEIAPLLEPLEERAEDPSESA